MVVTELLFHLKIELISRICLLALGRRCWNLFFLKRSQVFLHFQASEKASVCTKLKSFASDSNRLACLRVRLCLYAETQTRKLIPNGETGNNQKQLS